MKRFLTYLLIILFCSNFGISTLAQSKSGTLKGMVKTSDGEPAAYVNIGLIGTNKITSSDEEGKYELINIKQGTYTVKVSFVGLSSVEKSIMIEDGKTIVLDFTLSENASQISEVVVSAKKPISMGKINLKPLDLPQSVGVVSSIVIADQQAIRLGDVVRNVSGVSITQTRGGVAETFSARGYSIGIAGSGGSIFKNGVISNTMGFPDASTLESVEVLKGSSALLYGNVSGGVIINMITKKPKFNWGGEASFLAGSYNQYKPTLDIYGPISKNLAFRVVGTYENAKSFRDVVKTNRVYVNPSLLYKIGNKTDILLQGDYLKSDIVPDAGIGVPNSRITITEIPDAPRSRFINTVWAYNNTKQTSGSITINHNFNENWKLTGIGAAQNTRVDGLGVGVPNNISSTGNYTRSLSGVKTGENNYTAQLNLNGFFKTGSVSHQLLVGNDLVKIISESNTFKFTSATGVVGTAYDVINIFNRNPATERTDIPMMSDTARTTTPSIRYGAYAQDLVSITNKFKVLAGVRWSWQKSIRSTILSRDTQAERRGTGADRTDAAFSPKFALIYQPLQTTSLYASYTNNFNTNTGTDIHGDNLKPSIVDQFEVGLKNELFDNKLSANVSVYKIKNSNFAQMALFDANGNPNSNTNIRELSGETTSDGLEVDFNGKISKNFYFIAGYGYNFMRYTNTTGVVGSQIEGERLINNPAHTGNVAVFYTFAKYVKGLKLGVTAFYTGQRFGGLNNVVGLNGGMNNTTAAQSSYNGLVPVAPYTLVNISAGYSWNRVSLLAQLSNIFNEMGYLVHDRYSINPVAPRQISATLSYKFSK